MRLELKDLPPKMRQQALKIIAAEELKKADHMRGPVTAAEPKRFDSKGEAEFYMGEVLPRLRSGEIVACEEHPAFQLFDAAEFCGLKLGAIRYTADFKITSSNGTAEIIEIKSHFVRRMQRDYPIRRRIFIEKYARPNGWKFREVITDKDERGSRCGSS